MWELAHRPVASLRHQGSKEARTSTHRRIKLGAQVMLSLHGATPKWIKVPERRLSMVTFTIVSVLLGALLGTRFRVSILLPVVLLAVAIVAAVGLARESSAWRILLEIIVVMTALELGYLGGSLGARFWSASRKSPGALGEDQSNGHPAPTEGEARQPRILEGGQRLGNVN